MAAAVRRANYPASAAINAEDPFASTPRPSTSRPATARPGTARPGTARPSTSRQRLVGVSTASCSAGNQTSSNAAVPQTSNWIDANAGNIYYRPENHVDRPSRRSTNRNSNLPAPLIGPRRSRPHTIHIVTYPPGYVPRELRPKASQDRSQRIEGSPVKGAKKSKPNPKDQVSTEKQVKRAREENRKRIESNTRDKSPIRPVLSKILATFSNRETSVPATAATEAETQGVSISTSNSICDSLNHPPPDYTQLDPDPHHHHNHNLLPQAQVAYHPSSSASSSSRSSTDVSRSSASAPLNRSVSTPGGVLNTAAPVTAGATSVAQHSAGSIPAPRPADDVIALAAVSPAVNYAYDVHAHHHNHNSHSQSTTDIPSTSATNSTDLNMSGRIVAPPSAFHMPSGARTNSLMSVRSAKSAVSSLVTEVPKPVATGSGVTCSILLAEPNVFLSGFDHDGNSQREGQSGTALLRGRLQLNVSKNIKLKTVQLKLVGRARTEWPEGIPPLKADLFEEQGLRTQVLTFFNAMNEGCQGEYGNQCTYKLRNSSANSSTTNLGGMSLNRPGLSTTNSPMNSSRNATTAKDLKRLSLQSNHSRSFQKGDSTGTSSVVKGYKVFYPGTYDYTFELPIDHHQLETTKLHYGSVKWELHATIERAGAFKPNLHGVKEVSIVRVPDQMSLEMTEPISISRQWEDQLHYDIIISGKSFPIGSKIPIAFKLTPLAKVQVHKLKVFLTESVEYWTNDRRVTRKDPGRKILLLEKSAGKPLDSQWESSELRTVRGGELTPEQREEARNMAARRRAHEANRTNSEPEPLPAPTENILGELDLGLESFWGSTEIEANVQIPTCEMMAKNKDLRLNPDCSWKNVNVYHWIKIVMRISRLDPDDPTGTKRRHFEISIDSPFTVLNCRATQANTVLPAYSGTQCGPSPYQSVCGCPDAQSIPHADHSPNSSTGALSTVDLGNDNLPAPPQAAHLSNHAATNPATGYQTPTNTSTDTLNNHNGPRPIHLLRAPSYNPPAFDDDIAPPPAIEMVPFDPNTAAAPMATPPPLYDVVVGTPSVDGLADYFTRLADHRFEGEDSGSDSDESPPRLLGRSGRVNVAHPRTPGGRMPSRSLEITRSPIHLNMDHLAQTAATRH